MAADAANVLCSSTAMMLDAPIDGADFAGSS
jgi:hypothetical protein